MQGPMTLGQLALLGVFATDTSFIKLNPIQGPALLCKLKSHRQI